MSQNHHLITLKGIGIFGKTQNLIVTLQSKGEVINSTHQDRYGKEIMNKFEVRRKEGLVVRIYNV